MSADHAAASPATDFLPIAADGRVRLLPGACLALRSGTGACTSCRDSCPGGCIELSADGISVRVDCSGCGRCAATCPSGAIEVKGFAADMRLPDGNVVGVECWKVPAALSGPHALRVPCLGGLSPARWLGLAEAAGRRRVTIVDRGWCAQCAAAGTASREHPALPALAVADAILSELGWPAERRPQVQYAPLPPGLMPTTIPSEQPPSPARRAFFRHLGAEAKSAFCEPSPSPGGAPRMLHRLPPTLPERERLLDTSGRLAAAAGSAMPATPFVRIEVGSACAHDQLCARLCPTGALSLYAHDGVSGLRFDADACTNCGLCAKRCPQQAIRISAATHAPPPRTPQVLTAFGERPCARCRNPFPATPERTECPACARARRLGSALFGSGTRIADREVSAAPPSGGVHHEQPA